MIKEKQNDKNFYVPCDNYINAIDSRNRIFKIDLCDYDIVRLHRWYINSQGYVCTNMQNKKVKLHRFITDAMPGMEVDHINRDKSDNRRSNLRICNKSDNLKNTNIYKNNTSGVNGVSWSSAKNKWVVQLQLQGKRSHFGYFDKLDEAKRKREELELKYYGRCSPLFDGGNNGKSEKQTG